MKRVIRATSDVRYPKETSTQTLVRNAILIGDDECIIFHLVKKVNGVEQEVSHAYANIDTPRVVRCWIDLDTSQILTRDQISGLNNVRDLISYEYRPLTQEEADMRDAHSHAAFETCRR